VIFNTLNLEGTMSKIGAHSEAIKSGAFKDMGSPFRPISPAEHTMMQAMVDELATRFYGVVSTNRPNITPENFRTSTDGRVMSGEQAVKLGLADQTGLLDDAIDLARKMSKSPTAGVILYRRPYGYGGSIYASSPNPLPQANVLQLELPGSQAFLPAGFYYLWQP
jgi:protease-4